MTYDDLINWHSAALRRAQAKNRRTIERYPAVHSDEQAALLKHQDATIKFHMEVIKFLESVS